MILWGAYRAQLDPVAAQRFDDVLGPLPDTWAVVRGKASRIAQQVLYNKYLAGGPLAAPPGHSAHEWGLAIDVALFEEGKYTWDTSNPAWARLWKAVEESKYLHTGHDFPEDTHGKVAADDDHVEDIDQWRAKRAALQAAGQW